MSGNDALMVEWGDCDEQRSLGASVRRLLGTVVTTGASPSELSAAAAAIDRVTNKLAAAAPRRDMSGEPDAPAGGLTVAAGWTGWTAASCKPSSTLSPRRPSSVFTSGVLSCESPIGSARGQHWCTLHIPGVGRQSLRPSAPQSPRPTCETGLRVWMSRICRSTWRSR